MTITQSRLMCAGYATNTTQNITQPMPNGTCAPGGPTINVVGTTINGRHAYYWMTPAARAAAGVIQ